MNTLKEAIEVAKRTRYKTVICVKQDKSGEYALLPIDNLCINDLDKPGACYMVAYENNCIAIAVCSGEHDLLYGGGVEEGEINYCDL